MDDLAMEWNQIRGGFITAQAFHAPASLLDEQNDFRERAGMTRPRDEIEADQQRHLDGYRRAVAAKAEQDAQAKESVRLLQGVRPKRKREKRGVTIGD